MDRGERADDLIDEPRPWPLSWSAAWTGALASLAAITVFGLYGTAIGVGAIGDVKDFSTWHEVTLGGLVAAVAGGFFAYAIGGWVAGRICGARLSESTILHGAVAWLATIPMLLLFLALGVGKTFGGWYGGIAGAIGANAAATIPPSPEAIRHGATAAATSLLVGLIGSVVGGWMASGEPMTFTHHTTRPTTPRRPR